MEADQNHAHPKPAIVSAGYIIYYMGRYMGNGIRVKWDKSQSEGINIERRKKNTNRE